MSLLLLAVDTTAEHGSIALTAGGRLLEEVPLQAPDGFGHILFGEIQCLLNRHALTLADLGGFAAASGPGSFTGVRVGLTAIKGLAEASGRKVVAVSNLQALAWFGTHALRAVVMDARRGEVYGAVYDASLHLVCDEVVMPQTDWIKTLPPGDLEIIPQGDPAKIARRSHCEHRRIPVLPPVWRKTPPRSTRITFAGPMRNFFGATRNKKRCCYGSSESVAFPAAPL